MAEKRKFLTPQDLLEFVKNAPLARLEQLAANTSRSAQRLRQIAHCEDFFDKMDALLPTHDTARREAHHLFARMRAGRPNLPQGSF